MEGNRQIQKTIKKKLTKNRKIGRQGQIDRRGRNGGLVTGH